MYHVQFVAHNREKMLKGLNNNNNNNNSFSMESLLAENVVETTATASADEEAASDVLMRCLKNRLCSNCGRMDCNNFLQCCNSRMTGGGGDGGILKDNKPVLKFSVSAILGNEQPTSRNVQNGEYIVGTSRKCLKYKE